MSKPCCKLAEDYAALQEIQASSDSRQQSCAYRLAAVWEARSPASRHMACWFLEYQVGDWARAAEQTPEHWPDELL